MKKNKAVVTTDNFDSYYLKRKDTMYVGQEVEFLLSDIIKVRPMSRLSFIAACLGFMFIITSILYFSNMMDVKDNDSQVFAYISMDVNPGMELGIDREETVVDVEPVNGDGKELLDDLDLEGKNVVYAMDLVLEKLKTQKMIGKESQSILLSAVLNTNNKEVNKHIALEEAQLSKTMEQLKEEVEKKGGGKGTAVILQAGIKDREEAKKNNLSTGRYRVYCQLRNEGRQISIETVKSLPVIDMIKEITEWNHETKSSGTADDKKEEPTSGKGKVTPAPRVLPNPTRNGSNTAVPPPIYTALPTMTMPTITMPTMTIPTSTPAKGNGSTAMPVPTASPAKLLTYTKIGAYDYPGYYIYQKDYIGRLIKETSPSEGSMFRIVPGLADSTYISFEAVNYPGYYLRHHDYKVYLQKYDGTDGFKQDATFKRMPGFVDSSGVSYQCYNYLEKYLRHKDYYLRIDDVTDINVKKDATFYENKEGR